MAKQVVGPIEQHVEKAVLAFAGVGLIAVIALMYLVTSPNQIEIGGQTVTPTTVDQLLSRKANDVRQTIRSTDAPDIEFEPLADGFVEALSPFENVPLALEFTAGAMFGPQVPIIDPPGKRAGRAKLVQVLQLDKPEVTFGRSTLILPEGGYVPANWVTVSAVFDRERQQKLQSDAYGTLRKRVIFGPVELERRVRRLDGTWSDDDWESVSVWPAEEPPEPPEIRLLEEDGMVFVSRDDRAAVDRFQQALDDPFVQMKLLRPEMPEIYNGTEWTYPNLVPRLELLRMEDDYFHSTAVEPTPEAELQNRFMVEDVIQEAVVEEFTKLTPTQEIDQRLAEADALFAEAKSSQSRELAVDAYNIYIEVKYTKAASQSQRNKATKRAKEADQLDKDIRRMRRQRGGFRGLPDLDEEEGEERQLQPRQQLWAHDASPSSVKSGTTYQYRIRVNLYNRLAAEPGKFANVEDARVMSIPGEWSEPSDPIDIEPTYRYFVTGSDPRKKTVKVEIYRWFDGVWVTTRENFAVGDRLVSRTRVAVPDWENEGDVDHAEVDFDPDATIIDTDFNRPTREKKGRRGTVSFPQSLSEDCSIVLVNSAGELEERFVSADKAHPEKKAFRDRVYQPPRKR